MVGGQARSGDWGGGLMRMLDEADPEHWAMVHLFLVERPLYRQGIQRRIHGLLVARQRRERVKAKL